MGRRRAICKLLEPQTLAMLHCWQQCLHGLWFQEAFEWAQVATLALEDKAGHVELSTAEVYLEYF